MAMLWTERARGGCEPPRTCRVSPAPEQRAVLLCRLLPDALADGLAQLRRLLGGARLLAQLRGLVLLLEELLLHREQPRIRRLVLRAPVRLRARTTECLAALLGLSTQLAVLGQAALAPPAAGPPAPWWRAAAAAPPHAPLGCGRARPRAPQCVRAPRRALPRRLRRSSQLLLLRVGLQRLRQTPVIEQLGLQLHRRLPEPLLGLLPPARLQLELLLLCSRRLRQLELLDKEQVFCSELRRARTHMAPRQSVGAPRRSLQAGHERSSTRAAAHPCQ